MKSENITFSKYAFHFINNSLYYITLYTIKSIFFISPQKPMRQRMTKPTIRTYLTSEDSDQSVRIWAVWSVFADCICLLQPLGYPRGINKNPWHIWWMYRLIQVFAGHADLIVSFVACWLICFPGEIRKMSILSVGKKQHIIQAEWIKMPHPHLIFSQSNYLIQVVDENFHT